MIVVPMMTGELHSSVVVAATRAAVDLAAFHLVLVEGNDPLLVVVEVSFYVYKLTSEL